jgi:hypothetical protein
MIMIGRKAISADLKRKQLSSLIQYIDKAFVNIFGLKYGLPVPATVHHMVQDVWILHAKRA